MMHFLLLQRAEGENTEDDTPGSLRAMEFFDSKALKFLKDDFPKIPDNMEAAVWFEVETTEINHEQVTIRWSDRLNRYNSDIEDAWYAFDENDLEEIKNFRHAISYKVNEYIAQNDFYKLGTDTAVPESV